MMTRFALLPRRFFPIRVRVRVRVRVTIFALLPRCLFPLLTVKALLFPEIEPGPVDPGVIRGEEECLE